MYRPEVFCSLFCSANTIRLIISKEDGTGSARRMHGYKINSYKTLFVENAGKRLCRRRSECVAMIIYTKTAVKHGGLLLCFYRVSCPHEDSFRAGRRKYLFGALSVENCLRQGDFLSTLLLNLSLQFDTKGVQANQKGPKFNGTYQHQVHAHDVNLWKENIHILTKSTGALLVCNKTVVLEAITEGTKYVFMPREQNAEENHKVNTGNIPFLNCDKFHVIGNDINMYNCIYGEIKSALSSGNSVNYSIHILVSSRLLCGNKSTKICKYNNPSSTSAQQFYYC
jgi:hypothetical protein